MRWRINVNGFRQTKPLLTERAQPSECVTVSWSLGYKKKELLNILSGNFCISYLKYQISGLRNCALGLRKYPKISAKIESACSDTKMTERKRQFVLIGCVGYWDNNIFEEFLSVQMNSVLFSSLRFMQTAMQYFPCGWEWAGEIVVYHPF